MSDNASELTKVAIEGGNPVRNTPLPPSFPGAAVYGIEEQTAVDRVLQNKSPFRYYGPDVLGMVKSFEQSVIEKFKIRYALGVTSGTASLIVALKAAGIGPGDKVIVPAVTFLATAGAVIAAGAVPVFADVDDSLSLDPDSFESVIDSYTKAVMPVPILGNPCRMDEIVGIARKHGLLVIEDVAQSCGSRYRGKYSGTFGDIGCFSLQLNKIISTGEGGFVITDDQKLIERAIRYHDHGMLREKEGFLSKKGDDVFLGVNYRMSEITGAVALEQLKKLDFIISRLKEVKAAIKSRVSDINGITFRRINDEQGDASSALLMFLPDGEKAEAFIQALNAENIQASSLYGGRPVYMIPQLLHKKTVDKNKFPFNQFEEEIVYREGICPVAERLMARNVCLMLSPLYSPQDIEDIVSGIRKVAARLL